MYEEHEPHYDAPEQGKTVTVEVEVQWSNRAIQEQTVTALVKQLHDELHEGIQKAVFGKLDETVNQLILKVMDQPVQRTDSWGKPIGDQGSVRDLLQRDMEAWLNDKVDSYGKAEGRQYDCKQTRAQFLFKQATKDSLPERVKKTISQNVGDINDLIDAEVKLQLRKHLEIR